MADIDRKVNARFTAKDDGITRRFSLMARAAARFGKKAYDGFRKASRGMKGFGDITKGMLAASATQKALGMLTQGVGSVVEQFIDFDKAALGATVRFKDIGPEAKDFNARLKEIQGSAREAGATTEYTSAQAANALDFLARAGFTSTEAMGSLKSMIDLATASGEDFALVADWSSDLLGAFGLNSDNTAEKIANLSRLNDVLVKSANSANVTIETMFETMKTAGPVGRIAGLSLEEVAAATAILGNAGIKGTEAGTALKNAILNLSAPTAAMSKMMASIGVKATDSQGNVRKFSDVLADVGSAIKGMGTAKQALVLDTIFGKRAIAGTKNLIDSIGALNDFENTLKNAGKTSQLTAEIMRTSIDAKLKGLASAATEAGFKILNAFSIDGKNGIDALTQAIRNLDVRGLVADLQVVVEFLKIMLGAARMIWKVFEAIGKSIAWVAFQAADIFGLAGMGTPQQLDRKSPNFKTDWGSVQRVAPNEKEAIAKAENQSMTFNGRLDIAGAPEGSRATVAAAPKGFQLAMLGAN